MLALGSLNNRVFQPVTGAILYINENEFSLIMGLATIKASVLSGIMSTSFCHFSTGLENAEQN